MVKYFTVLSVLTVIALAGCKKEATDKASSLQNLQNGTNKNAGAALQVPESSTYSVVDNGDGTFTATMQPDSTNGQDAFVDKQIGAPNTAITNFNFFPEMHMDAWTVNGSPIFLRSYLRFVDLALIPPTAHVLSATLYLYGLSNSTSVPQGNSIYPGSPYSSYKSNRCIIEPADSIWDETTITWNNQPGISNKLQVTIPNSTSHWNYDVALDDVKAMVSRAVQYPDKNYGVRISLVNETYYRNMSFASSEASDPTKRPKLVVTYSN